MSLAKNYDKSVEKPIWEVELGKIRSGTINWYSDKNWKELLDKIDGIKWNQ